MKTQHTPAVNHRLTVNLNNDQYEELIEIAQENNVSLGVVLRRGLDELITRCKRRAR